MCGFVGWINHKEPLTPYKDTFLQMIHTLKYRGPDDSGYDMKKHRMLGHQRLAIIDLKNGIQPMHYNNYTIVYNGELYNTNPLREDLIQKGYTFDTTSDTEVLLKAYIQYKEKVLDKIEGIFAFAIDDGKKVFLARDRLGVKPLFYAKKKNHFLFASEIKAILKSKVIQPIINIRSLQELFALGPSITPGSAVYQGIKELKPGHYMIYKKNHIKIKQYWNIKNKPCMDSFEECKQKVRDLVESAIKRQLVSDVEVATLLSGGLDSSIITGIASKNLPYQLTTYSIDYEDNTKYFKGNDFQVSEDKHYIDIIKNAFHTNHQYKIIHQQELANLLKEAVLARDLPGMADIDSSLYWFSKEIKKKHKVILSGECADEIFGGYPWFYKEELLNKKGFPWISNLEKREQLLHPTLRKKLHLTKYAYKQYKRTLKEIPKTKMKKEQKMKNLFYLNMKWFMVTLLTRKDRMTMRAGVEARVPFADHHLLEYLWNIPFEYKYYQNQEKGLLREAFKDVLPEEIITRKKNPYPKTHHPKYAEMVSNLLKQRLENNESILYKIFDIDKIKELINTKGSSYSTPWFGQLMTGPQLIAYLYQFDIWAEEYKIILKTR